MKFIMKKFANFVSDCTSRIFQKVSIDLAVYKTPLKKTVTKTAYIDTNTKDRIV